MRFNGFDLNLLLAFEALVEECSVSRAAERLHMSQPAMSAALGRLREQFKDPILAIQGKRMVPTSHALRMRPMLREVIGHIQAMMAASTVFDPATSQRRFRIGASDYLIAVLANRLIPAMQRAAPGVLIELVPPQDAMLAELDQGQLDLIITPEEHLSPAHPAELLFEERHVVAGWAGNPLLARPMTREEFFAAGHIAVEIGRLRPQSFAETHLRELGQERRVEVRVFSFLLAPEMLVETSRLAIMQERLARIFATRLPIACAELPFPFPVMREMLQFNRTRVEDDGLRWLIGQLHQASSHP